MLLTLHPSPFLEPAQVRQAAERGVGSAGFGAAAFMKPLLQNLCLSLGDNEELCYCLKAWEELPDAIRMGGRPSKEEALQVCICVCVCMCV